MRVSLLVAAAAVSILPSAAEDGSTVAFGEGSTLYWTTYYDGSSDKLIERVVARGDDFEIYRTIDDYPSDDPSDFFAVYSGIDYRGCADEQATTEERDALKALWPLEAGKTANILAYGEDPVTVRIVEAKDFFLMGRTRPAHTIEFDYQDEDLDDEVLVVLDEAPITVSIRWSETEIDTVTLVTKPSADPDFDLSEDTIGNCAALLTDKND